MHLFRYLVLPIREGLFASVLVAVALLASCATLTKPWAAPEVSLLALRPLELSLAQQTLMATLNVRNPNDRTLPIKAMTYRLSLEGQELAEGGGALEKQIPAFGESQVDVKVVGSLLGMAAQLPLLAGKDRPLDWTVTGTATLADGLLTLPYRYSGQVDARELLARASAGTAPPRRTQ
jgi:LEA14-like dessication related protein